MRSLGGTNARWLAPVVAACLIVAGCQPSPTASPTEPATSGPLGSASRASPAASPVMASPATRIPLADDLRDAVDVDAIVADLGRLQAVAAEHGGARPAGSDGHAAAVTFVADQLRASGYAVELQPVEVPFFRQLAPSVLQVQGGGPAFEDVHDFKAMLFSASGEVTAPVFALGFKPDAPPGNRSGLGCNPEDWTGVPSGSIVLVQAAGCRRRDAVVQAQAAGALALVTAYPEWDRDEVLRPTLITPDDIRIPVLGVTEATGEVLADAAAAGQQVHVSTRTAVETRSSVNVIGETPGGNADHVVMLGGHLDSVVDGPGINDDGSGTMTVLEIARELAAQLGARGSAASAPAWKVRVGFWTGEEIGLLGSTAWVGRSGAPPLRSIAVYLNLDMLGSPNGGRFVYDGATTTRPAQSGIVSQLFVRALEEQGLVWQSVSVGSSDNVPFDQFGVPTSGLFSGANEIKSAGQAALFGGTGDAPADACFHLACDTTANIDRQLLGELARAAGWVVGALASGEVDLGSS
jgi:Zn-dependent M28 family amino/carboxypeptidase